MPENRPQKLETDLWKESFLHNFLLDLELKDNPKIALPRLFMRTAAYFSSKTALMEKRNGRYHPTSYKELADEIIHFAAALIETKLKAYDRVALLLKNSPAWVVSDFGSMMAACATVPIYENLIPASIHHILSDSDVHIIIVENKLQFQKINQIWPKLPQLKLIIVRSPEGIRHKNVISLDDFMKQGKKHLIKEPDCVSERVGILKRDDTASIVYTSGTTGNPKGVVLTHGNFVSNVLGVASVTDINSLDTFLSLLPLSHVFERTAGYYTAILMGATIAYAESIERIPQNLLEVRPTICCAVPRVFEKLYARMIANIKSSDFLHRLIFTSALSVGGYMWKLYDRWAHRQSTIKLSRHRPEDRLRRTRSPATGTTLKIASSLSEQLVYKKIKQKMGGRIRYFVSGGAPLSPELVIFFRNLGITIYEGYGMTETSPIISFNYRNAFEPGTVGKVLPNVNVKLSKDGEILVKGPNIMKGYYNNPTATAEIIDKDGWLHTGDVGTFDENNFLKITDRIKEIIVMSNGKNVAPLPIENKLAESPWLSNAMVIGNGRKYISVLLFPNFEEIKVFAETKGIDSKSPEKLCRDPQVREIFSHLVESTNKSLSRYEQIKKFDILPATLSVEGGELTPTLKIKRRIIGEKFADSIENLYK